MICKDACGVASDAHTGLLLPQTAQKAEFRLLYSKAALYEAALKVYTKPLFHREKGLVSSHDGETLYHFAVRGSHNIDRLHALLSDEAFRFRDGIAIHFSRWRKRRTAYIFPWEERIADELLYQMLNKFFDAAFSRQSYAFRYRSFGVDHCQHNVARSLQSSPRPLYVVKRDVSSYYPSVDQDILLALLGQWIGGGDYLYELLRQRVKFRVRTPDGESAPGQGIPFGTAIACLLANIYLTPLDRAMAEVPGVTYFRYADDLLAFSPDRSAARAARECCTDVLAGLNLRSKPSHELDINFTEAGTPIDGFGCRTRFEHLGLEFRVDGSVGLPRAKGRKIRNLFRRAFQHAQERLASLATPEERAALLVGVARQVLEEGCRSVAILDYYLRHVDDDEQLRLLDRWMAEEVLARVFANGHRKGNFGRLSFERLREMGLPSLRHRRRLLCHGHLQSSFFRLWTDWLVERDCHELPQERTRRRGDGCQVVKTSSPCLAAAAGASP